MRQIEGHLPPEVAAVTPPKGIGSSEGYDVKSFRKLVEMVAHTAYLNKDYLLFFRGQGKDYKNKADNSTFYPSIYRGDYLRQREITYRFEILAGACRALVSRFSEEKITGKDELRRKKLIQWSILQHYEVCGTPLLDFTHSLRVAASFAQLDNTDSHAYVFVFGLPYLTNRISNNSEHDLVNIRLLSICPPEALRPHFQEGYLAGTEDIESIYDSKTELDFNNRLIAKFRIPVGKSFWRGDFDAIPRAALYPESDRIQAICKEIQIDVARDLQPGQIGDFLKTWADVESFLIQQADFPGGHGHTHEAIRRLRSFGFDSSLLLQIDNLRRFRNQLVHSPTAITEKDITESLKLLDDVKAKLNGLQPRGPR